MKTIAAGLLALSLALSLALPSCTTAALDVGYANLELSGDIGFARGAQNISGRAAVDEGLGQGGGVDSLYGRLELVSDRGVVGGGVFASGFVYQNQGTGVLTANYGNISAGTAVRSNFDIVNGKVGVFLSFDIAGLVFVRPGLVADMFLPDLEVATTQVIPTLTETIDDPAGVPLPYLQVGVDTGVVSGFVEVSYLPFDTSDFDFGSDYDVDSETLDLEAMVRVRPLPHLELFAGYRLFQLELEGRLQDDSIDIDIELSGFTVGGGVRW